MRTRKNLKQELKLITKELKEKFKSKKYRKLLLAFQKLRKPRHTGS